MKARNYVGVITIGGTTIQILPKLYKKDEGNVELKIEEATRNLLFMLSLTKKLRLKETGLSMLKLKKEHSNLYESIIYLFARNLLETLKKITDEIMKGERKICNLSRER